jgi:hypothetical protein
MSRRYNAGFPVVAFLPMLSMRLAPPSSQAVEMTDFCDSAVQQSRAIGTD